MSLIHYIADMPTRGQLRSSTSGHLDVRQSCLVTVSDHSFLTAATRCWNSDSQWHSLCLISDNLL